MTDPTGASAPSFALQAVATGRPFRLADHLGRPVLILFVNHNSARASRDIAPVIRRRYPDHTELPMVVVADLRIVPRLLRGTVERMMEGEYREAAKEVPAGFDPADHLVLLPDWSGQVAKAYAAQNLDAGPLLVLVGPDGRIAGRFQGSNVAERALTALDAIHGGD